MCNLSLWVKCVCSQSVYTKPGAIQGSSLEPNSIRTQKILHRNDCSCSFFLFMKNMHTLYFSRIYSSYTSPSRSLKVSVTPEMRPCLTNTCSQYANFGNHILLLLQKESYQHLCKAQKENKVVPLKPVAGR